MTKDENALVNLLKKRINGLSYSSLDENKYDQKVPSSPTSSSSPSDSPTFDLGKF